MDFFIDNKEQNLYVTTKRNGSTLLSEISTKADNLVQIDLTTFANILADNKSVKIYAPIRDPNTRFKSGLAVNLYNRSNGVINIINDEVLMLFKHMITYFDNSIVESGKLLSIYPVRPFHLYDPHCDHWLGTLMIFSSLNYDLVPIPMNMFSSHLMDRFPEGIDYIKNRERQDSFDQAKPEYERLWDVYKEVIDVASFDKWMSPELEIFNMLMSHTGTELNDRSFNCLNDLLDRKIYFNDLYSPNMQTMFTIVQELSSRKLTTDRLDQFLALYQTIKDRSYKVLTIEIPV